jgi:hypothetical protein
MHQADEPAPMLNTAPSTIRRNWMKPALWTVMGAMTVSVVFYSEVPLLRRELPSSTTSFLFLLFPHAICGVIAFLIGPLQFSSRLRRGFPRFHRILGRIYVGAVFIAAPLAILLAKRYYDLAHDKYAIYSLGAIIVQGGTWILTTAAAFLIARNRHLRQHREWAVRSYAVTFTFICTRVLQPIPAWNHLGHEGFAMAIVVITFMAILLPDIAFHWKEFTTIRQA